MIGSPVETVIVVFWVCYFNDASSRALFWRSVSDPAGWALNTIDVSELSVWLYW
jgi:hypothetical protein